MDKGGSGQRNHWKESLEAPGATQMKHLRALMESLPFLNRIPDQSVLISPPEISIFHIQATRASDGSYALAYLPAGDEVTIDMTKIDSATVDCSWFDPRTGTYTRIGAYPNQGTRSFTAPGQPVLGNDWVLVLRSPQPSGPEMPAGRRGRSAG